MTTVTLNITKESVTHLDHAPIPKEGKLLQIRWGKVATLGDRQSRIFKNEQQGPVFVTNTGIASDEHVYYLHGGNERALHQYPSRHYADWRSEAPPKPELFDYGGFGEHLVGTQMDEENVCIGDIHQIGDEVVVEVSEPRNQCKQLNIRFDWPRALKRVQRTGRVGWNFRVLKTGYIKKGDRIKLLERPHPKWSCMNVKRVMQGKSTPLELIQEIIELDVLTEMVKGYARNRLESAPKKYQLSSVRDVTSRVKHFTFQLQESFTISQPAFRSFSFA